MDTKAKIGAVLSDHRVVGVSGLGVEQILCDCSGYWMSAAEYRAHLAAKIAEAL